MKVHDIKTLCRHYDAIIARTKTFELRVNDRDYRTHDVLHLLRFDDEKQILTGDHCLVKVLSIYALSGYYVRNPHPLVTMSISEPIALAANTRYEMSCGRGHAVFATQSNEFLVPEETKL